MDSTHKTFTSQNDTGFRYVPGPDEARGVSNGTDVFSWEIAGSSPYLLALDDLAFVGDLNDVSDARVKSSIQTKKTVECYDLIKRIELKTYTKCTYINGTIKENELGLIAQELEVIDEQLVKYTGKQFTGADHIQHSDLLKIHVSRLNEELLG